jgi:hypothetical protein
LQIANLFAKNLSILVNNDECGEALGSVGVLEFGVLVLNLLRKLFVPREIHQHEDEVFNGVILEFLRLEDFLVHANTPWAPIGTGKIEKDSFVVGFGLFDGRAVIAKPVNILCTCLRCAPKNRRDNPGDKTNRPYH